MISDFWPSSGGAPVAGSNSRHIFRSEVADYCATKTLYFSYPLLPKKRESKEEAEGGGGTGDETNNDGGREGEQKREKNVEALLQTTRVHVIIVNYLLSNVLHGCQPLLFT
ncbi:hypothetical protein PoB_007474200 [Plakobranchus ocellatus]|uniref:Uncharacterized protein n=1 Tax=Plakobranchus ocellatus TaxID=259542 RepID=A0AAV4DV71_9GAST|nr:hypothetical protein PoB_007474200 [Plakobranchus ocellatus]